MSIFYSSFYNDNLYFINEENYIYDPDHYLKKLLRIDHRYLCFAIFDRTIVYSDIKLYILTYNKKYIKYMLSDRCYIIAKEIERVIDVKYYLNYKGWYPLEKEVFNKINPKCLQLMMTNNMSVLWKKL